MELQGVRVSMLLTVFFLLFGDLTYGYEDTLNRQLYYVSTKGDDGNFGTVDKPWRTIKYAVEQLNEGETLIVEDGVYVERSAINFKRSGKISKPIIIKARNKHKAMIAFSLTNVSQPKINIINRKHIVIQGLNITQNNTADSRSNNKTFDIIIACRNSSHCSFLDNIIYGAFEEGIKVSRSDNIVIENNLLYDFQHEGLDLLNVSNSVVRNNTINEVGRVGIMVKGGSRNIQILDNIVQNSRTVMTTAGITIGGMTDKTSTFDSYNGFEAYNVIAINNKIIAKRSGRIQNGIAFMGAKESYAYNNNIIGADFGVLFMTVESKKYGWRKNTENITILLKNNIIIDSNKGAYLFRDKPSNLTSDYNLFFNNKSSPREANSVYRDPKFVDKYSNWDSKADNGMRGLGTKIPKTIRGFKGTSIILDANIDVFNNKLGAK